MNRSCKSSLLVGIVIGLFACVSMLFLVAGEANAAAPLFGWSFENAVTSTLQDRSRLIQVSCVVVGLGIALLYWKK